MSWSDGWVAIDSETTGVGTSARIVEVAAVTFEKGEVVNEWSALLCPEDVDWESSKVKEAMAVNRIDVKDLQGMPTFKEILPDLLRELSYTTWVAHNLDFDLRMLLQEFGRLEQPGLQTPPMQICTMTLAAHFNGGKPGNRLGEVAKRFGVTFEDAHRATVDARTCGRILQAMLKEGLVPKEDVAMSTLCRRADQEWKSKKRW